MLAEDLHHTGIVVDDLDAAMERLRGVGGYRWMTPVEYPVEVWLAGRDTTVTLRMVYSIDQPRLELIRQVRGTPWTAAPGCAIHHIGYLVDDLRSTSQVLSERGLPIEVCGRSGGTQPGGFAYHKGVDGIRIELVNRTVIDDLSALIEARSAAASASS